ncbi:hypothetical protein EV424DRAFT_1537758 [Suillus variegatus]|nr:hypothetical protein EV424DRAFT_1537758 [Suillus variegatus]
MPLSTSSSPAPPASVIADTILPTCTLQPAPPPTLAPNAPSQLHQLHVHSAHARNTSTSVDAMQTHVDNGDTETQGAFLAALTLSLANLLLIALSRLLLVPVCYYHHSRRTLHPTLHLILPVSSLLPLFWHSPVSSAYVQATSAFANVRRACALSTGGCWDRVEAGHRYAPTPVPVPVSMGTYPWWVRVWVGLKTPMGLPVQIPNSELLSPLDLLILRAGVATAHVTAEPICLRAHGNHDIH